METKYKRENQVISLKSYQFCRFLDNKPFIIVRNYIRFHHTSGYALKAGSLALAMKSSQCTVFLNMFTLGDWLYSA